MNNPTAAFGEEWPAVKCLCRNGLGSQGEQTVNDTVQGISKEGQQLPGYLMINVPSRLRWVMILLCSALVRQIWSAMSSSKVLSTRKIQN